MPDARPLTGEPLPLDLLNTRWRDRGAEHDLLGSPDGVAAWLAGQGLPAPVGEATASALRHARAAIDDVLRDPTGDHRGALNAVLRRGRLRREYGPGGVTTVAETDDPAWLPAWTAAERLLRLLESAPDRIRRCAHPDCILYFLDTTRNGTRRWCSMASCGNRSKSHRHYARRART